jgi:hypothetical protein
MREDGEGDNEQGPSVANRKPRRFFGIHYAEFNDREQLAAINLLTLAALTMASCAGFGFVAWYAASAAPSVQSGITAFGIALAGLILGALLGLLFGLPRARDHLADRSESDASAVMPRRNERFVTNTNLEEVSDWLTKIIVGIGLIQFKEIVGGIGALVSFLSTSLGRDSEVFALVLILYFPILGFLEGYIWARVTFFQMVSTITTVGD